MSISAQEENILIPHPDVEVTPTSDQRFGSVPSRGLEVRRKIFEQMAESNPTIGSGDTFIIRVPARSFIDLKGSSLRFSFKLTGATLTTARLVKSAHSIFRRVQIRDGRGNQLSDIQEYGRLHRIGLDVMVSHDTIDRSALWLEGICSAADRILQTSAGNQFTFQMHLNAGIMNMRDLYPALMTDGLEMEITIADFRKFTEEADVGDTVTGCEVSNISFLYTVVDFTPTYVQAYQAEAAAGGVLLHYADHRHVQSSVTGSDEISLGNSIKSLKSIVSGFWDNALENDDTVDTIGQRHALDIQDWQFFLGADPYPARRVACQGQNGRGGVTALWFLKQAYGIQNSAGLHSQGSIRLSEWVPNDGDVVGVIPGNGQKFAIGYEFEGHGFSGVNKIGDEIRLNFNFNSVTAGTFTNHSWIYFEKLARVTPSGIVVELNPT